MITRSCAKKVAWFQVGILLLEIHEDTLLRCQCEFKTSVMKCVDVNLRRWFRWWNTWHHWLHLRQFQWRKDMGDHWQIGETGYRRRHQRQETTWKSVDSLSKRVERGLLNITYDLGGSEKRQGEEEDWLHREEISTDEGGWAVKLFCMREIGDLWLGRPLWVSLVSVVSGMWVSGLKTLSRPVHFARRKRTS